MSNKLFANCCRITKWKQRFNTLFCTFESFCYSETDFAWFDHENFNWSNFDKLCAIVLPCWYHLARNWSWLMFYQLKIPKANYLSTKIIYIYYAIFGMHDNTFNMSTFHSSRAKAAYPKWINRYVIKMCI